MAAVRRSETIPFSFNVKYFTLLQCSLKVAPKPEVYSEPSQTSKMAHFAKTGNG